MRNVFGSLKHYRHATLVSRTLYCNGDVSKILRNCTYLGQNDIEITRKQDDLFLPSFTNRRFFSTTFISVHGVRPSAEYAKLRKESLESEFGQALGTYSSKEYRSSTDLVHFWLFIEQQ